MFGMVSVYRGDRIFAFLPATRTLQIPNSIMIKSDRPTKREGEKWDWLQIDSEADLPTALSRLDQAYRQAK